MIQYDIVRICIVRGITYCCTMINSWTLIIYSYPFSLLIEFLVNFSWPTESNNSKETDIDIKYNQT